MQSRPINNPYVDVREHLVRGIIKMMRVVNICESTTEGLLEQVFRVKVRGSKESVDPEARISV